MDGRQQLWEIGSLCEVEADGVGATARGIRHVISCERPARPFSRWFAPLFVSVRGCVCARVRACGLFASACRARAVSSHAGYTSLSNVWKPWAGSRHLPHPPSPLTLTTDQGDQHAPLSEEARAGSGRPSVLPVSERYP
jgi:hypothetical protein